MDLSYFPYYGKQAQVGEATQPTNNNKHFSSPQNNDVNKTGFALHVKSTSRERLAHHRTRPNTNQLSSTFSSAYVREPTGGCSLRPGRRETSQGPVQSGV